MLGAFVLTAGVTHLTGAREEFRAQVPGWVVLDPDLVVIVSGIVEIALGGALLLARRHRAPVGFATGVFFVLIFPGNISQFVDGHDAFGLDSDLARGVRLMFQPLLVAWAWWCTDALPRRRQLPGT